MSQKDVQVKEVDALHEFNTRFGDFLGVMNDDLRRILDSLEHTKNEIKSKTRQISEEREKARLDANTARKEWEALMSQSERKPGEVAQCRRNLEHLEGHVAPMIRNYDEVAASWASSAYRDIAQMVEITSRYRTELTTMIENGRIYLSMAENYIREYKEKGM